jgi:hypothetical protein
VIKKYLVLIGLLLFPTLASAEPVLPCISPHLGGAEFTPALGNADLTTAYCDYKFDLSITDGLPPGTTIDIDATLRNFSSLVEGLGGSLGGTQQTMLADLEMLINGTGALAGFSRTITHSVNATVDIGPRAGGETQSFVITVDQLMGQLFGDPDFDTLTFRMGYTFGLANSGSVKYYNLYDESWYIQLFLPFQYEIDFVGAPGSVLEGLSGTTSSNAILVIGDSDEDGVVDTEDNCVAVPNPNQLDDDGNGIGNLCIPDGC